MKKSTVLICALFLFLAMAGGLAAGEEGSWTGEVIGLTCYVSQGARGSDHADCAKACIKNGQPMGLLTDDGTLVLLAADHRDEGPYEGLKDLAGQKAEVTGDLAERDGMKIVVVKGAKPK